MNTACSEFRAHLAELLSGRGDARALEGTLGELSWHEHLLACNECRALLEAEQALEQLLASLPRPQLPPELTARVLARLEPHRASEVALDRLLELSTTEVPTGLASGVLARLAATRESARADRALDRLLERVPAPDVPAELRSKVLAGLRFERERSRPATPRVAASSATPRASRTRLLALAAGLSVALGLAAWWFAARATPDTPDIVDSGAGAPTRNAPPTSAPANESVRASANDDPPAELLAALDLLESWELVASDDIDVQLNALDSLDELLLSSDAEASAVEPNPSASEASPSKG